MFLYFSSLAAANVRRLVVTALLCSALASTSSAQLNDKGQWEHGLTIASSTWSVPKVSTDELNSLFHRWNSINEETKQTDNKFAGTYWSASNHASFLRWAPKNGFVYVQTYENLDVVDFGHGKIVLTSDTIQFVIERELRSTFFGKRLTPITRTWIPAEWKQQLYLVEAERISDFGMYPAGLGKYNEFTGPCCEGAPFLVKLTDKAVVDSDETWQPPWVPPQYARFLRKPIEAIITFVGEKRFVNGYGLEGPDYGQWFPKASLTPFRINAGVKQGVTRGLLFRIRHAPYGQYLEIKHVRNTTSTGVIIRNVDDDGRETYYDSDHHQRVYPAITRGGRVTTSPAFSY